MVVMPDYEDKRRHNSLEAVGRRNRSKAMGKEFDASDESKTTIMAAKTNSQSKKR
jgi:hypothetical protein